MGSFTVRAISLVTIVALTGTPAVAAACAALCMPEMSHSMAAAEDTIDHANHATTADAEVPRSDDSSGTRSHHHSMEQDQSQPRGLALESKAGATTVQQSDCCMDDGALTVSSARGGCCPDDAAAIAPAAGRTNIGALLATAAVLETPWHSPEPRHRAPSYGLAPAPPAPARSSVVLRV